MDIIEVLKKADIILSEYKSYCRNGDTRPVSIDDLHKVISDYTELKIRLHERKWESGFKEGDDGEGHQIKAKLIRNTVCADIYYHEEKEGVITYCDQRYAVTKEMGHLVIDTKDSFTKSSGDNSISDLVRDLIYKTDFSKTSEPYESELLAEVFAMEVLVPWPEQIAYRKIIMSGEKSYLDVAKHFRVPKKALIWILEKRSHDILKEAHDELERRD